MTFQPTPEQQAIIDAARTTSDNLMVQALAGAAKTSTLVLVAEALPNINGCCLAFNKKIAEEMTDRMPPNFRAVTLNSLGFASWRNFRLNRLKVQGNKTGDILKALIDPLSDNDQRTAWGGFGDMLKEIAYMKVRGIYPEMRGLRPLGDPVEQLSESEVNFTMLEQDLILQALRVGVDEAFDSRIDFDDQISLPVLHPKCSFPKYDLVMVDEAQDLSELNHIMLRKMGAKRYIAVGDPCQAIYAFRGADESSMENLRQLFDMRVLELTVSFRCPQAVVEHARWRAPQMKFPEWAKPGEIRNLSEWSIDDLPAGAAVICRNNAPILGTAMRMLAAGRYGKILGNDIVAGIVKRFKQLSKKLDLPQAEVLSRIDRWEERQRKRIRNEGLVADQAECLRMFAQETSNLGEAIAYAERILQADGSVQLMTGHKSKGLEFTEVFILDEHLIRDNGQDPNLRYVMQTRAQERLTYITSEGFVGGVQMEEE